MPVTLFKEKDMACVNQHVPWELKLQTLKRFINSMLV